MPINKDELKLINIVLPEHKSDLFSLFENIAAKLVLNCLTIKIETCQGRFSAMPSERNNRARVGLNVLFNEVFKHIIRHPNMMINF